jgi:hypothetical protein
MSLPNFSGQAERCSTAAAAASLFAEADRYRRFAKVVYPGLAASRATLERCSCAANGRVASEPVLLLGVRLLQFPDGLPDRQAVARGHYHVGWNFALNRPLGDARCHPTRLVNFRQRLATQDQSALVFQTILGALGKAGWVSRPSRQRLDSTQMFARVSRMRRRDCVRESLRLALHAAGRDWAEAARPAWWARLWDRSGDSQADYRAGRATLARKRVEAGADTQRLLAWLAEPPAALAHGEPARLLARVFDEQFELSTGGAPRPQSQEPRAVGSEVLRVPRSPPAADPAPTPTPTPAAEVHGTGPVVKPKVKGQLVSDRGQNPHEPEAT